MHRIDESGHASNMFTEGNPGLGIEATVVGDDWLNSMQEEVVNVVAAAEIALDKPTLTQLREAIVTKLANEIVLHNGKLVASVGANALTIAIKTQGGADPSAAAPVWVYFRDAAATTGGMTCLKIVAATSLVVSSGSTLGATNNIAFRVWVVGFNDGGTFRLGVVNCWDLSSVKSLMDHEYESSTAEGGAGAADSAHVIYSGAAVAAKAMRVLGFIEYDAGLAAVGTYGIAPTKVQQWHPGVPLPGTVLQRQRSATGAVATGTTATTYNDVIPTNTSGDQYLNKTITPKSKCNVIEIEHLGNYSSSASTAMTVQLHKDAIANALATQTMVAVAGQHHPMSLHWIEQASAVASLDYKIRAGNGAGATTTFNGSSGVRKMGGSLCSHLTVREIMA